MRFYFLFIILVLVMACDEKPTTSQNQVNGVKPPANTKLNTTVPVYSYEVINTYEHDKKAFTQGLAFRDGFLYESTGQRGESTLRKVELKTGKVLEKRDLANEYFGEGLTILGDTIYQLTWQSRTAFSYSLSDFKLLREFRYAGEGWGLTNDGTNLFLSDGTHVIRVIDPETFKTIRTIVVLQENGKPLFKLNELEYVKGEIWANVWHSEEIGKPNHIARIDPASGKLLGWINLDGISPDDVKRSDENTLNGIAYDEGSDRIFVTGKNWKKLFEIKLKESV